LLSILPFSALIFIALSMYTLVQNMKRRKYSCTTIYGMLTFNGILFLFMSIFTIFLFRTKEMMTISSIVYWLWIVIGLIVGLLSFQQRFIAGHLTSIAILLFMTFISIFSIGIILFIVAIMQFIFVWNHTRQYGLKS